LRNNAQVIQWPPGPVYSFLSQRRENVILEWLDRERVSKEQRGQLQQKLDVLEAGGSEMCPGLIFGPIVKDIYKLKIRGNKGAVQLRPMICRGPFTNEAASTLLTGAIERNGKLDPATAPKDAQRNRNTLLSDWSRRRCERFS